MSANQELFSFFFEMLNTIKLYHWKTDSFAQHKATDELHSSLSENIDKYVEVLLGKQVPLRINYNKTNIPVYDFDAKEDFTAKLKSYANTLIGFIY